MDPGLKKGSEKRQACPDSSAVDAARSRGRVAGSTGRGRCGRPASGSQTAVLRRARRRARMHNGMDAAEAALEWLQEWDVRQNRPAMSNGITLTPLQDCHGCAEMMRTPIMLGMLPVEHPRTRTTSERLLSSSPVENFVEDDGAADHHGACGCRRRAKLLQLVRLHRLHAKVCSAVKAARYKDRLVRITSANATHFGHDFGQHSIDMQPKPSEFHANIGGGTADKEGACVEVVHTWVVSVWRKSTHGGSMWCKSTHDGRCRCGGGPHIDPVKIAVQQRKSPSPTAQNTP